MGGIFNCIFVFITRLGHFKNIYPWWRDLISCFEPPTPTLDKNSTTLHGNYTLDLEPRTRTYVTGVYTSFDWWCITYDAPQYTRQTHGDVIHARTVMTLPLSNSYTQTGISCTWPPVFFLPSPGGYYMSPVIYPLYPEGFYCPTRFNPTRARMWCSMCITCFWAPMSRKEVILFSLPVLDHRYPFDVITAAQLDLFYCHPRSIISK